MAQFLVLNSDIIIRLLVAVALGTAVGLDRNLVHKEAGMKTHALVALGAALLVIISESMMEKYGNLPGVNPTLIISHVAVGVGFLGAGAIIFQGKKLLGLTTAGGLWVTAGLGMAAGYGLISLAVITTIIVLFVLVVINFFEKPLLDPEDPGAPQKY